jgi:hypothetical protein
VTLDWTGAEVFGAKALQFGLTEAQTAKYKTYWDPTNDYSFSGLAAGTYASTPDPNVPVYLGGTLVYGKEPPTTFDETCGTSSTPSPTPGTPPAAGSLVAQYLDTSSAASADQIAHRIQGANTGTSTVPLSAVTVRYWFTEGSDDALQYACDYAPVGCDHVTARFGAVSPAVKGADHYLELGFTDAAGSLFPGEDTGPVQGRVHTSGYRALDQSDDWSYRAGGTAPTTWDHVTVSVNGTLVSGTAPS